LTATAKAETNRMGRTTATASGLILDVDTFAVHDGPGIRMAVYFKGCPLRCAWCHSPESWVPRPELIFVRDRCVLCGSCAVACGLGVHTVEGGEHRLDRSRCEACGRCVDACPSGALAIKGHSVTAGEIVARAARLKPFFDHSGGGLTLTGGEITAQAAFAEAVLGGCREAGIHTAIETCGACAWEDLRRLLPCTDLVLFDLKLIDEAEHRRWTGASNQRILDNARRLAGANVQVRIPLIPGVTDTGANLRSTAAFMNEVGLRSAVVLPYNPSAGAKYEWLGLEYGLDMQPQDDAAIRQALAVVAGSGGCAVVG
jgi:pyruvate formate lyase activating enzyme